MSDDQNTFSINTKVAKVDTDLGLVFGWAIVCKIDGEDHFDLQDDHIPEKVMLTATTDFMANSRVAKTMHIDGSELPGSILFALPLTTDIAKALDLTTNKTGLIIAMQPGDDKVLAKFASGEFTGFSIGGIRGEDEEVD